MPHNLIVTTPFANYKVGERIKDEMEIARIRASHLIKHVVTIMADEPEPKKPRVDFDRLAAEINDEPSR